MVRSEEGVLGRSVKIVLLVDHMIEPEARFDVLATGHSSEAQLGLDARSQGYL